MHIEFGKWGNSVGVRIPSAMLKQLGLTAGSAGNLEIRNGGLFLSPLTPPLTLQQMINSLPESPAGEIDFGGEMGNEGVEW